MAITTTRILGEEALKGTLVNAALTTTGLTAYVQFRDSKTGEARTPQATTLLFTIDKDNERFEIIQADSHSTSSGVTTITINASGRALARYGTGAGSGTGLSHDVGASIGAVVLARPINELAAQVVAKSGDTMTGALDFSGTTNEGITVSNLTTAQRDALASPSNGLIIYNTTAGEFQIYQGGAWSTMASGSTQPNASTTVAGKVEIATDAELAAGTGTGGTGAVVTAAGDSFNATPTASKVPVSDSNNKLAVGWMPGTQIYRAAAGEAVDGTTTPQLVYVSDGANSRTAGRFYKADSDDTTNVSQLAVGFVRANASSVGTTYDIQTGIVDGFTGLTAGALYYSSGTAGAITDTPTTGGVLYSQKAIGIAISTTALCVYPPTTKPVTYTAAGSVTTGATTNLDVYTGYRAKGVMYDVFLNAPGATSASTNLNGVYNGSGNHSGTCVQASGAGGTSFSGIRTLSSSFSPQAAGSGANSCSMAFSVTINANYVRFTFVNAVVTTGNTGTYELGATIIPF